MKTLYKAVEYMVYVITVFFGLILLGEIIPHCDQIVTDIIFIIIYSILVIVTGIVYLTTSKE